MTQIRPIQSSDDNSLKVIIQQSLQAYNLDIPGTAFFDPELNNLSHYYATSAAREYFVAVNDNGEVLGGAGIAEYDADQAIAELQKLYLSLKARGQHMSYQLLDRAFIFAKRAGYQKVYLETHHNLETAIHLYRKYGFSELPQPLNSAAHSAMDRFFERSIQ